jgi:hypothetical protein
MIMELKFALSAALFLAAAPTLAQPPAAATPPAGGAATQPAQPPQPSPAQIAAIQQSGQAFGTCISGGVANVPATATPEAGATTVLAGCATQRQALVTAVEAMLDTLPADQKAAAHAQLESRLAEVPAQVADGIRQQRAAAAAAAAAPATSSAPAAPATPPPH